MPQYTLIAVNPAKAVVSGSSSVKPSVVTKAIQFETGESGAGFNEALKPIKERAAHYNYHPVAVYEVGALFPGATPGPERAEDAFPDDEALRDNHAFAVPADASMTQEEQPGDVVTTRVEWGTPIQAVSAGGETVSLHRLEAAMIAPGFGFRKPAVAETYTTLEARLDDVVVVSVRRDETTVAARAWMRSEAATGGPDRAVWFHNRGGDAPAAAAAVMAAVRKARGLDPEHYPAQGPTP